MESSQKRSSTSYLLNDEDIFQMKSLIEALYLAATEILESRPVREPPESIPAVREFDNQWQQIMEERDWEIQTVTKDDF